MINISKLFLASLISSMALLSTANNLYAEEGNINGTSYSNGGIGQEEADEMRTKAGSFNLRLYMSEGKEGHSITDAQVTVFDKKGNVRLDLSNGGPMVFLHVVNGSYKINAKYKGITITRNVNISNRRGENVYLIWKSSDADEYKDTEDGKSQDH